MIKVSLIGKTNENPINLISHAAKGCYMSKPPKIGKTIDVENTLFKTGHHTTMQHNYWTFNINNTSISSCTFGLHLTHSFYNSDQRSGRYSKMYNEPDFDFIKKYIINYWNEENIEKIISFIKHGTQIYQNNINEAIEIAKKFIKEERPFANEDYIEKQAPKLAQEQLRMFISTIFPTGLDITLNLSSITALWRSAWSPEMKEITNQMKNIILNDYPDLSYMFNENVRRKNNWNIDINFNHSGILKEPELHSLKISLWNDEINLNEINKDSVDLRYFTPENMGNNTSFVSNEIEVSIATYAQDQRHRTIKRSTPKITGNFYLSPILKELNLENIAFEYQNEFLNLAKKINRTLAMAIAPYGIMVKYRKLADLNALIHEQEKRLCWTSQEEIYNISRKLHNALIIDGEKKIADLLCPSCYKTKCIEGQRYCGRDLKEIKINKNIPKRKI